MQGRKEDKIKIVSLLIGIWAFMLPGLVLAQGLNIPVGQTADGTVRAELKTLEKEIMVGKPFQAQLEVTHPAEMVIIFPDTGGGFAPFELQSRSPQPTRSDGGLSIDFVVYHLWSWEVDSLQYLQLPIGYIQGEDTLLLLSNSQELNFIPTLPMDNDSLAFRRIENLAPVGEPIAWGAWGLLILALIIVLTVLVSVLYKPIKKWFRRRKIEREWKRYQGRLQKVPGFLPQQESYLLELSKVWKAYFDRDWGRGLGALSTKELVHELKEMQQLAQEDKSALFQLNRSADHVTYGGQQLPQPELDGYFSKVGKIMESEYKRRKEAAEL